MGSRGEQAHDGEELIAQSPFVRVIVVSYNGVELTMKCLESLTKTDWPQDRLEIVLVDNASIDDTIDRCRKEFPSVRILLSPENVGFAGGCNLGITAEADHVGKPINEFEYVALVNNDAIVESAWLQELSTVLRAGIDTGASAARVLLAPKFSELLITPLLNGLNDDALFCVSGLKINGRKQDHRLRFDETFLREVVANRLDNETRYWTRQGGAIRIAEDDDLNDPMKVEIELWSSAALSVALQAGDRSCMIHLEQQDSSTQRIEILVDRESFDVVNSAGCELYRRGFGGDRGFLERDRQQFEESTEIFAWSGAAVLLRRSFLEDVGLFDSRLFLYYEDFDLSWRGRLAGWRYFYAPGAIVRHHHAQTSVEGSEFFRFFTARNRLLVLAKNAPFKIAARAGAGEVQRLVKSFWVDVILRLISQKSLEWKNVRIRTRIVRSYFALLPAMLYQRWTLRRRVSRRQVMVWEKEKTSIPGFTEDDIMALRE